MIHAIVQLNSIKNKDRPIKFDQVCSTLIGRNQYVCSINFAFFLILGRKLLFLPEIIFWVEKFKMLIVIVHGRNYLV